MQTQVSKPTHTFGIYRHIEDNSLWAHIDSFGPFLIFVCAKTMAGPRYHVGSDFAKYYVRVELH